MRLVLHDGALGDVIVAQPAMAAFARSGEGPVVGIGDPDRLVLLAGDRGPLTGVRRSGAALMTLFEDPPRLPATPTPITGLLAFAAGPSRLRQNLLAACSASGPRGSRVSPLVLPSPRELRGSTAASRQLVAALPPELRRLAPPTPRIDASAADLARAEAITRLPAGAWWSAHLGAGADRKIPPRRLLRVLVEALSALFGRAPVLIEGPAELERRSRNADAPSPDALTRIEAPDAGLLLGLLAGSRFHLGLDSGPSHLAAALGRPGLALFGPGFPQLWGAIGPLGATPRIVAPAGDWGQLDPVKTARRAVRIARRLQAHF